MKAKGSMQGLPIQNLMKSPVKADTKSAAGEVVSTGDVDVTKLGQAAGKTAGKATGNVDFASLLEGAKENKATAEISVKGNPKNTAKISNDEQALAMGKRMAAEHAAQQHPGAEVNPNHLTNKVSEANNNLEQLINKLKDTSDESVEGKKPEVNSKNFFPNQKHIHGEEKSESPLDFLVKNSKESKIGESEVPHKMENGLHDKNSFFPNHAKIPNQLQPKMAESDSVLNNKENLKLVSGQEFVDTKKFGNELKVLDPKMIAKDQDPRQMLDLQKIHQVDASKVKGYQHGQNILNDNLIRNTKDLAFKEQKKDKLSSIDELHSPDMKKAHELSMIKEAPIPMVAAKYGQDAIAAKGHEAPKVLDLSKMNIENKHQLIDKISDYVMQNNVAGKDQLDLTVKHDQLGQFQIQVSKNNSPQAPNQIDMQIVTNSHEGHKFFVENESALMKSLQQSGVHLSDLRIVTSMSESSAGSFGESKQFNSFSQGQNGSYSSSQYESQSFSSGDFRDGKEKRNNLWNEYRERYGA